MSNDYRNERHEHTYLRKKSISPIVYRSRSRSNESSRFAYGHLPSRDSSRSTYKYERKKQLKDAQGNM